MCLVRLWWVHHGPTNMRSGWVPTASSSTGKHTDKNASFVQHLSGYCCKARNLGKIVPRSGPVGRGGSREFERTPLLTSKRFYTSHKKVFRMKTSTCRDGTLKNQPNKMGTTPQHIYTIPTSCAILPTMLCVC